MFIVEGFRKLFTSLDEVKSEIEKYMLDYRPEHEMLFRVVRINFETGVFDPISIVARKNDTGDKVWFNIEPNERNTLERRVDELDYKVWLLEEKVES